MRLRLIGRITLGSVLIAGGLLTAPTPATATADVIECGLPAVTEDGHRFTITCYSGPGHRYYAVAAVCGPGHCTRQGTQEVPYGQPATAWSSGFFTGQFQAFSA